MLVVLAETNCLKSLRARGVYPDKFYTDLTVFSHSLAGLMDADILIISTGITRFNKRVISELVLNLQSRAEAKTDRGINTVTFLSDTVYEKITSFFKYSGSIDNIVRIKKGKQVGVEPNFWDAFRGKEHESMVILSDYDTNNDNRAEEAYTNRHNQEDDLIQYIQVPDMKKLLRDNYSAS